MSEWSERYRRLMTALWGSPLNDQRPAVLSFLCDLALKNRVTLDVGAGDAYYLAALGPAKYLAVEPNGLWRQQLRGRLPDGVPAYAFRSVKELLAHEEDMADLELALLLHSLLYFAKGELRALLSAIRNMTVVVVHPDPESATTIAFEQAVGWSGSSEKIEIKRRALGAPDSRTVVNSHLYLPGNTALVDIAFLVSHCLPRAMQAQQAQNADAFVRQHADEWRRDGCWCIPQPQSMETYRYASLADHS